MNISWKTHKWYIIAAVIIVLIVGYYFWKKSKEKKLVIPSGGGGGGGGGTGGDPNALDANGFHVNQPAAYQNIDDQADPVLKYGTKGSKVTDLQKAINTRRTAIGQTKIDEDGMFGKTTEQALAYSTSTDGKNPGGVKELLYSKLSTIPTA